MTFPNAAKSRVRRKPRVRSEWTTLSPATIKECAVSALDKRESNPLTPPFAFSVIDMRATPVLSVAERIVAPLPSRTPGYQERHNPPVALVGSAVLSVQPVLLVHGTQDNVEGYERREDCAVRRHAR